MGEKPEDVTFDAYRARPIRTREDGMWYWECRWTEGGKRRSSSIGWSSRDGVRRKLAQLVLGLAEREQQPASPPPSRWCLRDLIDTELAHLDKERAIRARLEREGAQPQRGQRQPGIAASSLVRYETDLRRIRDGWGDVPCSSLSESRLRSIYHGLLAPTPERPGGLAPNTAASAVGCLYAAWRRQWEAGVLPADPRPVMPRRLSRAPVRTIVEPTGEQVQALITSAPSPWLRAWIALAAGTGMRPGEMAALVIGDVDQPSSRIRLRHKPGHTKTGGRLVQVPTWVWPHLAPMLTGVAGDALWPRKEPVQAVQHYLERALAGTDLEGMTPYGLRHACASALRAAGPDGLSAAQLGHTVSTFQRRYGSAHAGDLAAHVERASPGKPRVMGKVVRFRRTGTGGGDSDE